MSHSPAPAACAPAVEPRSGGAGPGEARIDSLDVMRGVAVMGIFSVNVIAFAMPFQAYFNPAAYGGTHGASLAVWALNFVLIDGKMRGLFTLLFGASTLLVVDRAEAAGLSPVAVHYRRMGWLLLFGCLHYYLVWFGDILTLYATMGMLAYPLRHSPVRLLVTLGLGLILFDMLMMGGLGIVIAAGEAAARAHGASAQAIAQFRETASFLLPPEGKALGDSLALYRGPWSGIVGHQLFVEGDGPISQVSIAGAETLGSILLGMAAFRSGFLTGEWSVRAYARVAAAGIGIGLAAYAALGWQIWRSGFDVAVLFRNFFVLSAPFRLLAMFGYAALIILLARSRGAIARRIAAVGRAAFTNYLGTSLLAGLLFYGWGIGLYGELGRSEAWLAAPAFWGAMLLWSKPWLDRYRYGPFEWAWRSLARGSPQPMRRPAAS